MHGSVGPVVGGRGQVALEFLVVFSFVTIIFTLLFALIASQRSATLSQQEYAVLQLQAQNVADYINQAFNAGNGYSATIPFSSTISNLPISIAISSAGAVIANVTVGKQVITAYAFSSARNLVINGTLLPVSGPVIKVYKIPTYRGSIYLQNSGGAIYVDMQPKNRLNLTAGSMVASATAVKVGSFDGTSSYVQIPNSANLQLSSLTLTGWVNYRGPQPTGYWDWMAAKVSAWGVGVCGASLYVCFYDWSASAGHTSTVSLAKNQWYFLAAKIGGGQEQLYLNGTFIYGAPLAVSSQGTGLEIGYGNCCTQFLNGTAANIQVYSTQLSDNDIMTLYNEGIDGAPVNAVSLTGWWPLHGNANDYSGNGNDGTPTNLNYESATQVNVHAYAGSANAPNTIVGFEASRGTMSSNVNTVTLLTGKGTGNVSAFVSSNGLKGIGNLTINVFGGDPSLTANLVGWWPLDGGYGSVAYDISGYNSKGTFNTPGWSTVPLNRSNFIAATLPGDPAGVSGSNTLDGFVTVAQSDSMLNIARNNSFTSVIWANYSGDTTHWQGLMGDWNSIGGHPGFALEGSSSGGEALMYVNASSGTLSGNALPWPAGISSVPKNNWGMVTAQYNGYTGLAQVYFNNTLVQSGYMAPNLKLAPASSLYIGDNPGQPTGLDGFNGIITNAQLYSSFLSSGQISALYRSGISSHPLNGAGLVGWWPLAGDANDSSTNGNNGAVNYNVVFGSANMTGFSNGSYVGSFNGLRFIDMGTPANLHFTTGVTLSAWIYPTSNAIGTIISKNGPVYLAFGNSQMSNKVDCVGGGILSSGTGAWKWLCGNTKIPLNAWSYVAMTYNQTNETVWYNGKLDGSIGVTGTMGAWDGRLTVGWGDPGYNQYFNGYISGVQAYNKALNAQQILQIYQQGLPKAARMNISLG